MRGAGGSPRKGNWGKAPPLAQVSSLVAAGVRVRGVPHEQAVGEGQTPFAGKLALLNDRKFLGPMCLSNRHEERISGDEAICRLVVGTTISGRRCKTRRFGLATRAMHLGAM